METRANEEKFLRELESEQVNTTLVKDIRKIPEYTRQLQELVSNKMKTEQVSMVKLNARCSVVLQNELPPKEKDPGSFVLPCIIGTTTVSNALTDLEARSNLDNFGGPKDLEELLMDEDINRDLGSFLQNNNLLPGYKDLGAAPPSPNKTAIRDWNLDEEFQDPNDDFCIGIDNITTIDALWDNLDPGILTNKKLSKLEFLSIGNRVHRNHPYNLQIIC
ncbi:hypothetical protein Tco_0732140 [Tanacetum coccineum]